MEQAITIWVDESTEINLSGESYNLIGYLITNSDTEEYRFLNRLKQARKGDINCWNTLHGCELKPKDAKKLALIDRWLLEFKKDSSVYFHCFLYKRNDKYVPDGKTYEHYFAKQSIFALANRMKKIGVSIETMFSNVSTLTVLFDRRRSHSAEIVSRGPQLNDINRLNDLELIYIEEIKQQIEKISKKNPRTHEFTVRFSFLSSECFDAMQFTDCMLYLVRQKIEQEKHGLKNVYTEMFDKHFLSDLDPHTRSLGFKKIYEFDKKFNFFESAR